MCEFCDNDVFAIPNELAHFIGVSEGSKMEFKNIVAKTWDELKKRKLIYNKDKRVFRVDEQTGELFNLPMSVNESIEWTDSAGFNAFNIYDYVKRLLSKQKKYIHKPTGFAKPQKVPSKLAKPQKVPSKLAKFIGVEAGDELTGPDITLKVWDQLKKRDLTYDKDRRVFRTNKEVSELFNIPMSVNESINYRDEKGFNFCNLQKYIKNALHKE
jgi:chromatin remodeling complex protein RSC6